ncbi:MAG: hydrogenase maturation protease [Candidatus Dormiibacterota bacterium]
MSGLMVFGLGEADRRDDGVGGAVLRAVMARATPRREDGPHYLVVPQPLDLLGVWAQADCAVIVDAVRSGAAAGTVHSLRLGPEGLAWEATSSSHGIGLGGVLRLAQALGQAPRDVWLVGVEGADFGFGVGLSPRVWEAVPAAARRVSELLEEGMACA